MFNSLDPKKMQAMMKQMGIKQEEIPAKRVVIEQEDGKIFIENPSIVKIEMQGQESWQITGDASEEKEGLNEVDIQTVMQKTGCLYEDAKNALEKNNGDLAEAILGLS